MKRYTAATAVLVFFACAVAPAAAQTVGRAQSFAIVGGSAVSANGAGSIINGDVGSPGPITGFPGNATILPPFSNLGNTSRTTDAATDLLTLYLSAPLAPGTATDIGTNNLSLGGVGGHYTPGRYTNLAEGGVAIMPTGITLDTPGVYVFTVANQLVAAGNVVLGPGVDPCTVFWRTGAGAATTTLNGLLFSGTVVSDGTIALGPAATVTGRVLTTATGPVTLAGNNTIGGCSTNVITAVPGTITVTKAFTPNAVAIGGTSELSVNLINNNSAVAVLSSSFVDILPSGLVVAAVPNAATNCTGNVVATPGGNSLTLAAGSQIPGGAPGSCSMHVTVTSATAGAYTNTIPINTLQTSNGNNIVAAIAILSVGTPVPTLPQWALLALAGLLAAAGVGAIRLRRA